jgi:predicted transcriptional regulator YdeE
MGLALNKKTYNANGQSAIDCGNLWQEFEKRKISSKIPNPLDGGIFAVYYDYEGDHTKPYAYFIGCKVQQDAAVPEGLDFLTIPESTYQIIEAKGKMPDCVGAAWMNIWNAGFPRAYQYDFEVYDHRSRDWQQVEVDIFLSIDHQHKVSL